MSGLGASSRGCWGGVGSCSYSGCAGGGVNWNLSGLEVAGGELKFKFGVHEFIFQAEGILICAGVPASRH